MERPCLTRRFWHHTTKLYTKRPNLSFASNSAGLGIKRGKTATTSRPPQILLTTPATPSLAGQLRASDCCGSSAIFSPNCLSRSESPGYQPQVLRLGGEWEFSIPLLPLPDLTRIAQVESGQVSLLAQNTAVALFTQRAQARRADFQLTSDQRLCLIV